MKLLGSYSSNLNAFHYEALLALLQESIASGDYAGGKGFDSTAAQDLQAQGKDFESLPLPAAGDRATDEEFNHPLNILSARYSALESETSDFLSRVNELLTMLEKDTALLDQILATAESQAWAAALPQLGNSTQFIWDFAGGYGAVTADIKAIDPRTSIEYSSRPPLVRIMDCATGTVHGGISAPLDTRSFAVKRLQWSYASDGETEELYGADWAKLALLERGPKLTFADTPTYSADCVDVTGSVKGGTVPIYVNIHFIPRRASKTINLKKNETVKLCDYRVQPDEVDVLLGGQPYTQGVDFTVTQAGMLTSKDLPEGADLTVCYTEYFPAYQCSVNQLNWSNPVMLDSSRPYVDDETEFLPVALNGDKFPITDETGVPTGLYLRLKGVPQDEVSFQVTTPASNSYGARATLTVELEHPAYMTGVTLAPFSSYPATLERVVCHGVVAEPALLFDGSVVLDRKMTLNFERRMVRRLELTFTQTNYTLKEHTVDPPDKLRRDTLSSLQNVLPFAVRRTAPAVPKTYRGAQYEFGFESIQGEDWKAQVPSVFVTGPYRVYGCPEIARLDLEKLGEVDAYLYFRAYNSAGTKIDDNENSAAAQITPGTAIVVSLAESVTRPNVAYADLYLKFVFRSADALAKRFFLQVSRV
jgi:hypothetical protein